MANIYPSVIVNEIDKSGSIGTSDVSTFGAFAGNYKWGPAEEVISISSENDLVDYFGEPDNDVYLDFFVPKTFLEYSRSLKVVRAIDNTCKNAVSDLSTNSEFIAPENHDSIIVAYCDSNVNLASNVVASTNAYGIWSDYISTPPSTTLEANIAGGSYDEIYMLVIDKNGDIGEEGEIIESYLNANSLSLAVDSSKYYKYYLNIFSSYINAGSTYILGSDGTISLSDDFTPEGSGDSEPIADDSSLLVKNDDDYDVATLSGSGAFIGRYPGSKANGLLIAYCDAGVNGLSNYVIPSDTTLGTWDDYFNTIPGTSSHAVSNGGLYDEMHILIIDKDGKFSGTKNTILEKYEYVSKAIDGKKEDGTSNFWKNIINDTSEYIRIGDSYILGSTSTSEITTEFSAYGYGSTILFGGVDVVSPDYSTAYELFADAKKEDISHFIAPANSSATIKKELITIAENRGDAVAYISPAWDDVKFGQTFSTITTNLKTFKNTTIGVSSSYYFADINWKQIYDKYNDVYRWIPCCGDTAGLSSKCDVDLYPWYSFGGYNRGVLRNVVKLAWNPTDTQMGELYKIGLNSIVREGGTTVLLGDKTGLMRNSATSRVNVRKLYITLKKKIKNYLKFGLFEFNDEYTREQLFTEINAYMISVKSNRGVIDFRVVIDESNNTSTIIDNNEMVIDIYIKPNRSTNWIKLNVISVSSSLTFNEVLSI